MFHMVMVLQAFSPTRKGGRRRLTPTCSMDPLGLGSLATTWCSTLRRPASARQSSPACAQAACAYDCTLISTISVLGPRVSKLLCRGSVLFYGVLWDGHWQGDRQANCCAREAYWFEVSLDCHRHDGHCKLGQEFQDSAPVF